MFAQTRVETSCPVRGVVARPSAAGGEPEALLFEGYRIIQVVVGRIEVDGANKSSLPLRASLCNARCPAYEPTSDCVLFADNDTAILQLDRSNAVSLVAGNLFTDRSGGANSDRCGKDARFLKIAALAPDGQGSVYIADSDRIRKLDVASRQVTTLPGTNPPRGTWVGLSYDIAAGVLWAATDRAVCVVDVAAAGGDGGGRSLRLGDLAVGYGEYYYVNVISGLQLGPCIPQFRRSIAAATSSQQHSQALVELHKVLTAQSASPAGDLDSTVTVRVDGGGGGRRVFLAHRSVLAARSEYFRRLLDPAGGFADSGEAEVALEDADPEAFSWLLAYMYTGELHMPDELLRPAAELAGRLLMPADCSTKLVRLLATVTPGSVVSELIWAAQHDMAELVARLKAYLVRHRKVVACDKLGELVARFPDMAASLTRELTAAP
ncbi:Ankyrin repeat and BTB/POZ domain-containing protein 1 [Pleodorina starrii]|nr:Ankyrin repeat and BTB/POZ domain-containing protein 1 [Pleodorina starrii]